MPFPSSRPSRPTPADAAEPRVAGQPPKAPITEQGVPSPVLMPWSGMQVAGGTFAPTYQDDREYAPDLRWGPSGTGSVAVYSRMEGGDAQIKGLLGATTLPVRRKRWEIDPAGADGEVVEHVADDFNLPIAGDDEWTPNPGGFNHDRHLAHALRALGFGHFYFERVYRYSDPRKGGDGRMHLAKLGTRPPRTIMNFIVGEHGELLGIIQNVGFRNLSAGDIGGQPIDANSLLAYVWDSEDDGDWIGRSMLRPIYRNWLLKDRLLRVDATLHERNGMGVPWFETDTNATQDQINDLAKMAQEVRAGTRGGGAGPGKLGIKGVEGSLPDTIGSVRYHDQQMASAFLAMFVELGKGETGSYSLGAALVDFHDQSVSAIADWYASSTQAQIEDTVLVNFGDVPMPRLIWTTVESKEASLADLALAVEKGLIVVDDEFREQVGQRFKIAGQRPEQILAQRERDAEAAPAPAPPPPAPDEGEEEEAPAASAPPAPRPKRSALADAMLTALTGPTKWPDLARAVGSEPKNGTARRARDLLIAEGAIYKRASDGTLAPTLALNLPDRELKRNPQPFEVEAAVDFARMDQVHEDAVEQLVAAARTAQADQVAEVKAAVEGAEGSAPALASISVAPIPLEVLEPILQEVASEGVASARGERDAQVQGASAVAAAEPDQAALEATVRERAEVAARTLAVGLSAAASKKAAALSTLAPAEAATQTAEYLEGLSDAALTEQLGGAAQQAYNSGRFDYMAANSPQTVYASELLDRNTCTECNSIDGTEWPDVAAARESYPIGGYVNCEGGLRCRGTAVAVYV